jgi:hypothetical protein
MDVRNTELFAVSLPIYQHSSQKPFKPSPISGYFGLVSKNLAPGFEGLFCFFMNSITSGMLAAPL